MKVVYYQLIFVACVHTTFFRVLNNVANEKLSFLDKVLDHKEEFKDNLAKKFSERARSFRKSLLKTEDTNTPNTRQQFRSPALPTETTTTLTAAPATTPPAVIVDECTRDVWELLPNGEFIVVRKNVCEEPLTTLPPLPSTITEDVVPTLISTPEEDVAAINPDLDECTQEVWELLPNGEFIVVRRNVCNSTPLEDKTDEVNLPELEVNDHLPQQPATISNECTQEIVDTLPNGAVVVIRKSICGEQVITTSSTPFPSEATIISQDGCTQESSMILPSGELVVIRKGICSEEPTPVLDDGCTNEVSKILPNGDFILIRHNVCTNPVEPIAVPTYVPAHSTTVLSTDGCTQETSMALPSGEVVVVRRGICQPAELPATPEPSIVDECTKEIWETLPSGEVVLVRRNVCGPVDICFEEVTKVLPNGDVIQQLENICEKNCTETVEEKREVCQDEESCVDRNEVVCNKVVKEVCEDKRINCRPKNCKALLKNVCDDNGVCGTKLIWECDDEELCDVVPECRDVEKDECVVVAVPTCRIVPLCHTVTEFVEVTKDDCHPRKPVINEKPW